jgi:MFS family permease
VIYILANISLALQHNFQALLLLRGVQSCGSSGTVALASAVAADIITSAERGLYMGFTSLGNILAPSIGPILGGALNKYLGWQAIFWFLALAAGTFFVPLLLFFPETCREIVGNGSIPAVGWNRSIWNYARKSTPTAPPSTLPRCRGQRHSPWSALRLLFYRPVGLIILSNGVVFASYYAVTAGIPLQFEKIYNLDGFHIGLCFIPAGLGSLLSATANGVLVDWNYRRTCCRAGLTVHKNQKQDILGFPIEKARLQIGLPMTVSCLVICECLKYTMARL